MMSSRRFTITALAPSASFADAVRNHWSEYLMEAAELAVLMFCICLTGTLVYSRDSPLRRFSLTMTESGLVMGVMVAAATWLIICSPYGRRTGAHLNPAITVAYLWLGRIHRWDAISYVVAQFAGALAGVFLAHELLGRHLAAPPVRYVVTLPGMYGRGVAFVAEFLLAALAMGVVLFATNHRKLAQFSPYCVALITVFGYLLAASISGFSVNPARSFSSALFARIWQDVWIYFAAPCLGMVAAAAIYVRSMGPAKVYCAKVFHDLTTPCPFPCRFEELFEDGGE